MQSLYEKFRPPTLDDMVGQSAAVKKVKLFAERGFRGRAFWICGPGGTGKTSLARIIALLAADEWATYEIDAQELIFERVETWVKYCAIRPIGKGCYAFIVNEAHSLDWRMVRRLQTVLERADVQRNSVWVFTTTAAAQQKFMDLHLDAGPLMSRMIHLYTSNGEEFKKAMAERARQIAAAEGLDGKPIADYLALAEACGGNGREMLQRIDAGEMLA